MFQQITINNTFSRAFSLYPRISHYHRSTPLTSDDESESETPLAQLHHEPIHTSPYFFNKLISSCAKSASLSLGQQIHSTTIKLCHTSNVFIATALIGLYTKCDKLSDAQQLFDEMPQRNVVTWSTLISGYSHAHDELSTQAFNLFKQMLAHGITPTPFTISSVLLSCAKTEGIQIHALCFKFGLNSDVVAGTALVGMYSKCCASDDSKMCFDEIPEKNIVTWTTMISAYAHKGESVNAMILARDMPRFGVKLNKVTYNSLLSSVHCYKDLVHGKQVHCLVIREGFESDSYIVTTLLTMYSECDCLEDFRKISKMISCCDQISWNSVVAGFSQLGDGQEAFDCFRRMRQAGIPIDFHTLTSILKAVSKLSALEGGKQAHALAFKTGYASNMYVQNGLVSMYARCGVIDDCKKVFSSINKPDLVSWNSLLSGCAQHGNGEEVVENFEIMRSVGIKPDHSTFLSVLTACSHVGLLDHGLHYFHLMKSDPVEPPRVEHYACVVDLLGRAGYLDEAESFINSMPIMPGPSIFKALLSASRVHGNMEMASHSAKRLLELYPNDPAAYVLQSSVFAEGGYWDAAEDMRKLMYESGVRKKPGYSWIGGNQNDSVPFVMERNGGNSYNNLLHV